MGCRQSQQVSEEEVYQAAKDGKADLLQTLIESGGEIHVNTPSSVDHDTPLLAAAKYGHLDVVKILLEKGAFPNMIVENGMHESALIKATGHKNYSERHFGVVKTLLKNGADANKKNKNGETALMMACKQRHLKTVQELITHKADVNVQRTTDQVTALMLAIRKKSDQVVNVLLGHGADVNLLDARKTSALIVAAKAGSPIIVEMLLNKECNVDQQDSDGNSALIVAARKDHVQVAEVLLEYGADPHLVTKHNKTAAFYAQVNSVEMQRLFQDIEGGQMKAPKQISFKRAASEGSDSYRSYIDNNRIANKALSVVGSDFTESFYNKEDQQSTVSSKLSRFRKRPNKLDKADSKPVSAIVMQDDIVEAVPYVHQPTVIRDNSRSESPLCAFLGLCSQDDAMPAPKANCCTD